MRGAHWRRVPWVLLSCLCACLLWPVVLGNTVETSLPVTGSLSTITSGVSVTSSPKEISTAPTSSTSTGETSTSPQTSQTQSTETTQESPSSTYTQVTTSPLPSSTSGTPLTVTNSQETSQAGKTTTSSSSSVSNTPPSTSEVLTTTTSTDSTPGNTVDTSLPVTGSLSTVTSGVSVTSTPQRISTAPTSSTCTGETSASPQTSQTQSTETTWEPQTSTLTEVNTSLLLTSPSRNTLTVTNFRETSQAGEATISSSISVSNTPPMTSEVFTMTTSIDSSPGNTGDTSLTVTGSLSTVTSGVSVTPAPKEISTVSTSSTFPGETSSQNHHTQSTETTQESQSSAYTQVTTSTLPTSPNGTPLTVTGSQETSQAGETTTSSSSNVSNTPPLTSRALTETTSTDPTPGNTGDTSLPVTRSLTAVTSEISSTAQPGQQSVQPSSTSALETSTLPQTSQTQSMETTQESPSSTHTQVTSSTLSPTLSGATLMVAVSSETTHPSETTSSSPSTVGNTPTVISNVLTTTTSIDSPPGNTGGTSLPVTGGLSTVTSGVSVTSAPKEISTAPTSSTSTGEASTSPQTSQTQSTETTQEPPSSTYTQVTSSTLSTTLSGNTLMVTNSHETSEAGETTTPSSSSVSDTSTMTSKELTMTTSTDSTPGNTVDTSLPVTGSLSTVTSGVLVTSVPKEISTAPTSSTCTGETATSPQTSKTQSTETTQESPSSTYTHVTSSTLSPTLSGATLTVALSSETTRLSETTTPFLFSVSNTPTVISNVLITTTSTDSPPGNTVDTSLPVTGSLSTVTSGVSVTSVPKEISTAPTSSTSTGETSTSPQTSQTQSTETTQEPPSSTYTQVTSSTLSPTLSGATLTVAFSSETTRLSETTTLFLSSVSNTPTVTSNVLPMTTSTDSPPGNTGDTSLTVSGSLTTVTSEVSSTARPGQPTVQSSSTSALETSTLPQTSQTQSMETTQESPSSTYTQVTSSTLSPTLSGATLMVTNSHETSEAGETTTPSSSSVSDTPTMTSKELTMTTSTDSTPGNTVDTSLPVTGSLSTVTSGVSVTSAPKEISTAPASSTSTGEASTSPQTSQTQSTETIQESPSSTYTQVTSSTLSTTLSGNTLMVTNSHETSEAGETTTPSSSSVSDTPTMTSKELTMTTSTDSTPGNTVDTSLPVTGSLSAVTSGVLVTSVPKEISTASTSSTCTGETSTSPPNLHTQSTETTQEPPSSPFIQVTTSTLSPSQGGNTLPVIISLETSHPGETATSSSSSISNTPPMTSKELTMTTSTDFSPGNTGNTSLPVTGSLSTVTSGVSVTSAPQRISTAPTSSSSTGETSTFSKNPQTQSTETTGEPHTSKPASTFPLPTPVVTASTSLSTARSRSSSESASGEMFISSMITRFSPTPSTDSYSTQLTTQLPLTSFSGDTTPATMGVTSVPGSFSPTMSDILTTGRPTEQSIPTFPSNSPWEISAISKTAQTQTAGTTGGSETVTLASQVTSNFSTVTLSSASSIPSGRTSPPTEDRTLSPSATGTNFIPSPVSDSHGTQSTVPTLLSMTTDKPQSPTSAVGISSTPTPEHPETVQTTTSINPRTSPKYMAPTSSQSSTVASMPALSFLPTNYPSIMTTPESSSASKSTLQPSTDFASSGPTSSSSRGTEQTVSSLYTSTNNSSFSQSALAPVVTWSSTTLLTGDSTPLTVTRTSSVPKASSGPTGRTETSGMVTTSLRTDDWRSTATSPPSTTSLTLTTSTPSTSTGSSSTAPTSPVKLEQGVPLLSYGWSAGDLQVPVRTVDITSRLFKSQIGFPLGSSLRDSLYFTDDGLIIFPESDNQLFSYPNPPPRGFTGWERVAMVAPFWADADFSSHRGTIFYQEYETLYDEYNPLVRQVETWIKKFKNTWNYKAKWTLKVTWVNAPAYPAQWTFGTNTYQAILSTDGSRSYALFLYQSGGMLWDSNQPRGNPVLMGFTSGDGYFENSPLMSRPVREKYRPDQFLNSRLGLRGLQFYMLHREERPNYRLKCLTWWKSQPQWPSWGWNQITCPCSWQQGRRDLRFQPIRTGWWGLDSRQLCSFSSWRRGVCCSYGRWGEFREGWSVQSPWQLDQELEPQNWCCRWNDKPFFCTLYQTRRPRISCAGYRPPRLAWAFGDPHLTTLDGANYTFNGLGDFLLIRGWGRNSSFLLQGRTAQTGSARATNFIAFAAQYNSNSLAPITVQWFLESNDTIRVLHNNQSVTFEMHHEDTEDLELFNATGVLLTRNGSLVSASFDGMVTISVMALSNILHASSSLPEEYQNHTEGLLGVWNNDPKDDFMMPNGSTIPQESTEEMFYHYGMTWKINGTGLLGERDDPVPSNFTPVFYSQQSRNHSLDERLTSRCNGDQHCIYDAWATGNVDTGLNTKMFSQHNQQMNLTLNQYPPSIKDCDILEAYKNQTKRIQCTSNSEDVIFTLRDNYTDLKLFENGTLLWMPTSLEPFTLEILSSSAKVNLFSVLQPKTVACFCNAESQCLYNQTSRVGNSSLEVASCKCDGDTFGRFCDLSKDPCTEQCFPEVQCIPRKGCGPCPPNMTGDGRHCAEEPPLCWNHSCPVNYCYNHGHCYISQTRGCQPTCTCPQAFTDDRCLVAGNNFTPTIRKELPLRTIRLSLSEDEEASAADVNASVAYRLGTLDVRAFFQNSLVQLIHPPAPASGSSIRHWTVVSEFQYRARGPVIHFLNHQLQEAVVDAFLPRGQRRRQKRSEEPRNNVSFYPISREDVHDVMALDVRRLDEYFECSGYKDYHLVYSPESGVSCVSPCSQGYCYHGGQCQHLPNGPRCSCKSFSIYSSWGERCEHLSMKLGAFFGILFGALGALLLLGIGVFVILHFWGCSAIKYSYPMDSAS